MQQKRLIIKQGEHELDIIDFIKLLASTLVPLGSVLGYIVKRQDTKMNEQDAKIESQDKKIEHLHDRMTTFETQTAVVNTKLDHLNEKIIEVKLLLDKLVDRK
jgi:hypothetical protein